MPPIQVPQQQSPNPYKGLTTAIAVILNLLFFFFVGLFISRVFIVSSAGLTYLRPTDVTPWILLPVFGASAVFLASSIIYQFLSRKTTDVYLGPVLFLKVLQLLVSIAIVAFIVNALTCAWPHLWGMVIC